MLFATWVTALNILVFAALVAAVIYQIGRAHV